MYPHPPRIYKEKKDDTTYQISHKKHDPSNIPTNSSQVQKPHKHRLRPPIHAQIRQARQRIRSQHRDIRHTTLTAPPQALGRLFRQREAVQRTTTSKEEAIRFAPRRSQDDGIDDVAETGDAGALDAQDERAGACVFGAGADGLEEVWVVGGDSDGDDERAEDVEDDEAIDESFGRFRDIPSRCLALASGNRNKFRTQHERKARSDKGCPESENFADIAEAGFRIAFESARMLPVAEAEPVVVGAAAEEEDDAEDDEA